MNSLPYLKQGLRLSVYDSRDGAVVNVLNDLDYIAYLFDTRVIDLPHARVFCSQLTNGYDRATRVLPLQDMTTSE